MKSHDRLSIVYLTVVIVAAVAVGILTYGVIHQNTRIDTARYEQCVDQRILIEKILLRGSNATLEQWNENPGAVLEHMRELAAEQLKDLGIDPNTESAQRQIDRSVNGNRDLLNLADPSSCVPPR